MPATRVSPSPYIDTWKDVLLEVYLEQPNVDTGRMEPATGLTDVNLGLGQTEQGAAISGLSALATERANTPGQYFLVLDLADVTTNLPANTFPHASAVFFQIRKAGDISVESFAVVLQNNAQHVEVSHLLVSEGSQIKQLVNFGTNPAVTDFTYTDNAAPLGTYGNFCSGVGIGDAAFGCAVGSTNLRNVYFGATQSGYGSASFVAREAQSSLAQAIRARVAAATAGVARP